MSVRSGRAASGALAPSHANDARGPASAQSPEVERCYALSASETIDRACVLAKMHHIPSQISTPLHRHISHLLPADESNEDYTVLLQNSRVPESLKTKFCATLVQRDGPDTQFCSPMVARALLGLGLISAAVAQDPCLEVKYTMLNYKECCTEGAHSKDGHKELCEKAKTTNIEKQCLDPAYASDNYMQCCANGGNKLEGRVEVCKKAKKISMDGDDRCLEIKYAVSNYAKCCAGGSFKLEGRKEVCEKASVHVKKKEEL